MDEKIIYLIVALLIWFPLVTDQYLLEYKFIEGVVTHISLPSRSNKGFKTTNISIKEPNRLAVGYSVNSFVAEKLSINSDARLYESRLFFRVMGVDQGGAHISNNGGGINRVIMLAIFMLPLGFLAGLIKFVYRKIRKF